MSTPSLDPNYLRQLPDVVDPARSRTGVGWGGCGVNSLDPEPSLPAPMCRDRGTTMSISLVRGCAEVRSTQATTRPAVVERRIRKASPRHQRCSTAVEYPDGHPGSTAAALCRPGARPGTRTLCLRRP